MPRVFSISSLLFGLAHLFNGFSPTVLLQVGYTILTGGLFAFCFIKTKNIRCCGVVHGVFNFCGQLYSKFDLQAGVIGLGTGVVFGVGTIITMSIVSVLVGIFVVYKVLTYTDSERACLYKRLGIAESESVEKGTQG